MTKQEHALIVTMFVKQQMFIKMLIEVLKSRGIVSDDDMQAFEFRVNADIASTSELFASMTKLYDSTAQVLGIRTDL